MDTIEVWGMAYTLGAQPVVTTITTRDVMLHALGQSDVETTAHGWEDHTRGAYSVDRPVDGHTITCEFDTDTDGTITGWTAILFDDDGDEVDAIGGAILPETAEDDLEGMSDQIQAWIDPKDVKSIAETIAELISVPVVDHGTHEGIEWAVTAVQWPESRFCQSYTQFNGYVLIPEGHPWRAAPDNDYGYRDGSLVANVSAPGGITFNRSGVWGFDTNHYADGRGMSYRWNRDMVRHEAMELAAQVADYRNRENAGA